MGWHEPWHGSTAMQHAPSPRGVEVNGRRLIAAGWDVRERRARGCAAVVSQDTGVGPVGLRKACTGNVHKVTLGRPCRGWLGALPEGVTM